MPLHGSCGNQRFERSLTPQHWAGCGGPHNHQAAMRPRAAGHHQLVTRAHKAVRPSIRSTNADPLGMPVTMLPYPVGMGSTVTADTTPPTVVPRRINNRNAVIFLAIKLLSLSCEIRP